MEFWDTHIHLYADTFAADRETLIKKALSNGVKRFYLPNIDADSIDGMLALEKEHSEHCFALMGLHPCSVNANYKEGLALVEKWLKRRAFVGIGEIGIDLYWDNSFFKDQQEAFAQQVNWALEYQYPIIIHSRNAHREIIEQLRGFKKLPRGIFHCFSGNQQEAEEILQLGDFKLGIGGVLTFKNSGLEEVVKNIGIQHLVLETDAPYLAPVPHRGKRNEPAYILEVALHLSRLKGLDMEELALQTTNNAREVFKRG